MIPLIALDRCRVNGGTFVECAGRELAVFVFSDPERAVVLDNTCPHAGGNLSGGELCDGAVWCPSHRWAFSLDTGVCTHSDRAVVRRYPAEIRDEAVWVNFSEEDPAISGAKLESS